MDDLNINKMCLSIEEVELDGDEEEWIKLSWTSNQNDNEYFQSTDKIQRNSDNETAQTKDYDNKESFTNAELEDVSDGISVITESDTDANTNLLQICQFNHKPHKPLQKPEMQIDLLDTLFVCVLGIIIGLILSHLFIIPETYPASSEDAENLKSASHNIVNTCKELTDGKTMLNEIKKYIPADKKITKEFLVQYFEITDSSNKTSSEPTRVTEESFNSTLHPLDQLQISLYVLSSLAFIYNDNSLLKSEINKTLDIVNNTKAFYDTLALFTNTQDVDPIVLKFLQRSRDNMDITSKSLLSDLVEKMSKAVSKVYNKYAKERHRLNKKLCHLKNTLLDDKLLKRLTENNQLFKDYDKSCFSNSTSKNWDGGSTAKGNTKIKSVKEKKTENTKTDDRMAHAKYDKMNTRKIRDNSRDFLKNKKNKKQDKSAIVKFLRNSGHKIRNASRLFVSKVVENISELKRQLSKELHYLKNTLPTKGEFLKQLFEDDKKDSAEFVKRYEGKNNLQSNVMPKNDVPKNSFDNIFMPLKNTCPLSINYCPKLNINVSTLDTVPNYKTKNYKYKKHVNNKKTITNDGNSARILSEEGKNGPKGKKEYSKSNDSTKKIIKTNYERKDISSQNKIKDHASEHTVYHKSEHSLFDSRTMKQDNQRYTNVDRRSDKSSQEYRKQRDDSNWYFQRAFARRNARKHAEYMYQQDTKWSWKNRR